MMGYYNHRRWREGDIFEMNEKALTKKDDKGKVKLPLWVEPADTPVAPKSSKRKAPFPGARIAGHKYESVMEAKDQGGSSDDDVI
jgi:hypothetical protein